MDRTDDKPTPYTPADAIIGGMLGWLFILVGSAMVAATALVPAYLDTLDVQEAREIEAARARMLAEERQRYQDFHLALIEEDPVLLERLAMTELRLKPAGTGLAERAAFDPLALVTEPTTDALDRASAQQPLMRSIENELSRPDLKGRASFDADIERPKQTKVLGYVTGETRPYVAGFGALLLLVGLWPRRTSV
ncbi:MAG: hypothetical protein ACE37H_10210 [Phycisphaeraceae bacterium]